MIPAFRAGGVLHRRLWQAIPREARRRALFRGFALLAPRPAPVAPPLAPPVVVAGMLSQPSGLGEGARLQLAALQENGIAARGIDLSSALKQGEGPPPERLAPGPGTLIVHVGGPMLPWALFALGRGAVRGRRVVACWAWELSRLAPDWAIGLPFAHEIWACSAFCAEAMRQPGGPPVRVVPYPLTPPAPSALTRADFGLPEGAFVALCAFNAASSMERKNPLAAVLAFRKAFGDAPDRTLVLKTMKTRFGGPGWEELRQAIAGAPNIRVIEAEMPRADVQALMRASDALLSLHRAEGFGLHLAEAMALARPVIATGWSGNMDFMDDTTALLVPCRLVPARDRVGTYAVEGACWADPDTDAAAALLLRAATDREAMAALGSRARDRVTSQLSPRVIAELFADAVGDEPS